jgi:hypothetical protein
VGVATGVTAGAGVGLFTEDVTQILKPMPLLELSEWNLNVVAPDTAIEARNALADDVAPQYFVPPATWR